MGVWTGAVDMDWCWYKLVIGDFTLVHFPLTTCVDDGLMTYSD